MSSVRGFSSAIRPTSKSTRSEGITDGSWTVNSRAGARTNLMEEGQRVLLWVTSGSPEFYRGFWASGQLTSEAFIGEFEYSKSWLVDRERKEEAFVDYDIDFFSNGTSVEELTKLPELAMIEPLRAPQVAPPFLTLTQLRALNPLLERPFDDLGSSRKPHNWAPIRKLAKMDIAHRRLTERVGMDVAEQFYTRLGYEVADVSADWCGYDQVAEHELGFTKHVEVKGLSSDRASVGLTRNEIRTAIHDVSWQLVVVTDAHHEEGPVCQIFSREKVLAALSADGIGPKQLEFDRGKRVNMGAVEPDLMFVHKPLSLGNSVEGMD